MTAPSRITFMLFIDKVLFAPSDNAPHEDKVLFLEDFIFLKLSCAKIFWKKADIDTWKKSWKKVDIDFKEIRML